MQRFFFNLNLWKNILIQDENFFHQISHVLRAKIWDEIVLFNWDWNEYIYKISEITKNKISLDFIKNYKNTAEPWLELNLYQAIPNKYEKIEYILQKWVEIWISNFIFFYSERSQILSINNKKEERFNFIIKEATEQCGGNKMPKIIFENKLMLEKISWENLILHTEKNSENFSETIKKLDKSKSINLFVWPEWWWNENEIINFKKNNFKILNFWERILRTETAGIVVGFLIWNFK